MPRQVITADGHDRDRSLGWAALWWIETFVVHGRGGVIGQPIRYGDEAAGFILDCYVVDKSGRRLYDSAFLSRPKGCDKSGLAAALCLWEAFGNCRFDRWAEGGETYEFLGQTYVYQPGEPIGKPVVSPMVRINATEEQQAGNTYDSVYYNLATDSAPLSALVRLYGVEVNKSCVLLSKADGGGEIRPSTAGAASKDGGLETFVVFDETHEYKTNALRKMYGVVSRNVEKRRSEGSWFLETSTMYAPGEESSAELTYQQAQAISEGKARNNRLLFDHRWGDPGSFNKGDGESEEAYRARLRAAFVDAYGDAVAWNSPDTKLDQLFDLRNSEADIRRYYLNALVASANSWLQVHEWESAGLRKRREQAVAAGERFRVLPPLPGDQITLGFDGGQSSDATVLIGCRVSDRYVFPIKVWERPDGAEGKDWAIDRKEVAAVVAEAHEKFDVAAFFADPPFWQSYVDDWALRYGANYLVRASAKHAVEFWTNRATDMAEAVARAHTAIVCGEMVHGDDPVLYRHVMNARRWKRASGYLIGKDRKGSDNKMDAAVGMVLALEAAAQVHASGKKRAEKRSGFIPFDPRE